MNDLPTDALATTSSTNTALSVHDRRPPPVHSDERAPGSTFILISRALPYAYLLFITGLGWHLYGGAPGGSDLAAAFILLLAPPGAALFLLPFVPLPGFVRRALRRREPAPAGRTQLALAQTHRHQAPQLLPGPARPSDNP